MPGERRNGPADVQPDPAVLEAARVVPGERGRRAELFVRLQQNARFDQHLEAVADAQDQFAVGLEAGHFRAEVVLEVVAQDAAGGHVVAVAEAAGDAEDLELPETYGLAEQRVDVQRLGCSAGLPEGEGGFLIAIGARGSQN